MEIALCIERRAKDAPPEADLDRVALAYARVARAVRQSVLLQSRLIQDLKALEDGAAHEVAASEAQADEARFEREEERKLRVERIVGRVAKAAGGDEEQVEALVAEAGERLDDDGLYAHVMSRPVSEIVADICRDLGLDPDWPRLAEEAWAKAEIESGAAGWPFVALLRTRPPPLAGRRPSGPEGASREPRLATSPLDRAPPTSASSLDITPGRPT